VGVAVVGWWGLDGGCVGFWVCSRQWERGWEREREGGRGGRETKIREM